MPDTKERTYGEKAVGLDFNPGGDMAVRECKAAFAEEIDRMDRLREHPDTSPDQARFASIAITEMQGACMFAVAAATADL